jgi:hypothetical protein
MNNTPLQSRTFLLWTTIISIVIVFNPLFAQIAKPGYDANLLFRGITGVTTGGVQQNYTLNGYGTLSQQSVPISIAVPISNRILLLATNAVGVSKADTSKLQGITDTRISLSYVLPGEKIWMTAGVSIPTGKTKLTNSELETSSKISQTALGLRIPVFGQGFNGNAGFAYATAFTRRLVLGLGASYVFKGEYEPIEALSLKYNPGDEISVNAGIDFITYSKAARLSLDVSGTYFFKDQLSGKKIFQSGARAMMFALYSLKLGELNHQLSARIRYRLQNTFITDSTSTTYAAGTQAEVQYALTKRLNEWLIGSAVGEIKYYTPDQLLISGRLVESGTARSISVGPDFLFALSETVSPTLSMRYVTGTITIDDVNYAFNGFEAGVGLKISF